MRLRLLIFVSALLGVLAFSQPLSGQEFVEVLESNDQHTLIRVHFPEVRTGEVSVAGKTYQVLEMEDGGFTHEAGRPQLPFLVVTLAIPPLSGVDVRVLESEHSTLDGYTVYPYQTDFESFFIDEEFYQLDSFYPAEVAGVGEPAILRDYRIIPLRLYPVSYNPSTGVLYRYYTATVEIRYEGASSINPKHRPARRSPSFEQFYKRTILNYEFLPKSYGPLQRDEGARYLIITHDDFYDAILPLYEWKNKKGMKARVVKLSEIGSSTSQIKAYIQEAYDTWDIPPEYVLLVGDTEYLPAYNGSDNYYAKLEGTDIFADVYVGRFSVDNVSQCNTMVSKTLGYERTPYMDDPDWFRSGCLIVRDDYDAGDDIYYENTWYIYALMESSGFTQIDTLFRKNGDNDADVEAAVTDGRTYVNFRGQGVSNWWSPFGVDPEQTYNGFKLPIVVSATCGTGTFSGDSYICEPWIRAGTAENPKGAVGFFGASTICGGSVCTSKRGVVSKTFFRAVFQYLYTTYGQCANHARYDMHKYFEDDAEYEGWNVLGDPELNLWISTPDTFDVVHNPAIPLGPSDYQVQVYDDGQPAVNVWVCVLMDSTVYEWGQTDPTGQITFSISPVNLDTLWVTVTSGISVDFIPYEGYAVTVTPGPFLTYDSSYIDDGTGGNGDGFLNPGETIELWVGIINIGADTAFEVSGHLRTQESFVTLIDSVQSHGDIAPGHVGLSGVPYLFEISPDCPDLDSLYFSLFAQDTSGNDWTITIPVSIVHRAEMIYADYSVDDSPPNGDGDGKLEGGESAYLTVTLQNDGLGGLTNIGGVITSSDPYLEIIDSLGNFGDIPGGGSGDNGLDPFFVVSDSESPHGYYAAVDLALSGDGYTYTYIDTLGFSVGIAPVEPTDPTGPDGYGYYAYDDTDILWGHAPTFEWFEIAPPGPGSLISNITNQDAATTTLDLPFTFKYYNANYDQVSVCSNGFLAMGVTAYRHGDNSSVPNIHGPDAMISPFWDDLDPSLQGDIYQYNDTGNHRFIVEFKEVAHYGASGQRETFQVIFYDPSHYPTTTGDGEIVFLYNQVSNISSNTVGIENLYQTTGIQYLYNGTHDTTSSPPVVERAIKFTTFVPEVVPTPSITLQELVLDDSAGGNGDSIADAGETVEIWLTLVNDGDLDGNWVVGDLHSSDPDVSLADSVADFGNLSAGGGTGNNESNPYVFQVSTVPQDSFVDFYVLISANGGTYETTDSFSIHLGSLEPRLPDVTIQNHSISDSAGGNDDGVADAGEQVEIWFTLINNGETNATSVEGRFRSQDSDVTVIDSVAQFGDLAAAGGTGNNESSAYLFQVSTTPLDSFADFQLHITSNGGNYDTVVDFTLHLGALTPPVPDIIIYNYSIADTIVGNGDGIPDPGETVHMTLFLLNDGNLNATTVSGILHTVDPDAILLDSLAAFGDIPGWGGSGNNEGTPYGFEIAPTPEDDTLSFTVDIEANGGDYTAVLGLLVPIGSVQFTQFLRADADADSKVSMSDATYTLKHLYIPESPPPPCMDAADVNDDGTISMADVTYLLQHLYVPASPEPPLPYPNCGPDPTQDELGCDWHPCMGLVTKPETQIRNGSR